MARKPRTLTAEERALWDLVARQARPLHGRSKPDTVGVTAVTPALAAPAKKPKLAAPAALPPARAIAYPVEPDRNTKRALRRGAISIERKIDLHGLTQAEAHRVLEQAILAGGARRLLIVTGRGAGKSEGGVLRRMVPRWIGEPALAHRIAAFGVAQPGHGGEGAYYLLLKRRREQYRR